MARLFPRLSTPKVEVGDVQPLRNRQVVFLALRNRELTPSLTRRRHMAEPTHYELVLEGARGPMSPDAIATRRRKRCTRGAAGTCSDQKDPRRPCTASLPFTLASPPVSACAFGLCSGSRLRGSPLRELLASESMYFAGAATAQQVHHLGSLPGFPPLSRLSCPGPDDAGRSRAVGSKSCCRSVRRSSGSPRSVRDCSSRTFFSVSRRFRARMRAISASQLQPSPGVTQATTRR